ncbi:hypothetical protein INR49_020943 [Caranx melampygus]|nr:hypothetical protein INR49_020943 [Caranx melampygus]
MEQSTRDWSFPLHFLTVSLRCEMSRVKQSPQILLLLPQTAAELSLKHTPQTKGHHRSPQVTKGHHRSPQVTTGHCQAAHDDVL